MDPHSLGGSRGQREGVDIIEASARGRHGESARKPAMDHRKRRFGARPGIVDYWAGKARPKQHSPRRQKREANACFVRPANGVLYARACARRRSRQSARARCDWLSLHGVHYYGIHSPTPSLHPNPTASTGGLSSTSSLYVSTEKCRNHVQYTDDPSLFCILLEGYPVADVGFGI